MLNLFSPHGNNPLSTVKLTNARCARVDFDRTVKSNVLTLEGDLTQSKLQLPKEDRGITSLQLIHPLLCLQIWIPSSGQFSLELSVSHSSLVRMKLTCGTHISKPDVHDVKGVAHVKLPLAIPRVAWTQVVFHVPGIFSHLFGLPPVRWVDTIAISGSVRLKRILVTGDEQLALESRPPGMLLYTLPAYGPPLWTGRCGVAQTESNDATEDQNASNQKPKSEGIKVRFARGEDGGITFSATSKEMEEEKRLEAERAEKEELRRQQLLREEEERKARELEIKSLQDETREYVRLLEASAAPPPPQRFGAVKKVKPPTPAAETERPEESPSGWEAEDIKAPKIVASEPVKGKERRVGGSSSAAQQLAASISLVHLPVEPPSPNHPADNYSYTPKAERQLGFGVGCLDVIHCEPSSEPPAPARQPVLAQRQIPQTRTMARKQNIRHDDDDDDDDDDEDEDEDE